jgi:hypothetical protein
MREDQKGWKRMKIDFRYKLVIQLEEQKVEMLRTNFFVNIFTGNRQAGVEDRLRLQQSRIKIAGIKMGKKALEESAAGAENNEEALHRKEKPWWQHRGLKDLTRGTASRDLDSIHSLSS